MGSGVARGGAFSQQVFEGSGAGAKYIELGLVLDAISAALRRHQRRHASSFGQLTSGKKIPSFGGEIRSIPETIDHFFILNRVFYRYYTTTLLIILITTLQIRIIRVQLVIIRLLLGSWLLLLTHPPGTRVEINLDAVLSRNLAKELLNLE